MVGYRCKPKSRPMKPWLVSFLMNNKTGDFVKRAEIVKVTNNVTGAENGESWKHVTDGEVYIKVRFSEDAVKQFLAEIEDESQTDWSSSMVILQHYSLEFEPNIVLNACEYVLKVDKFKLWDLQEGFSRKANDLHFCMENDQVKAKALQEWHKWREGNQNLNRGDHSEEASQKDESSSVPLSQLLAEMACPSMENTVDQSDAVSLTDDKDAGKLSDSLLDRLCSHFSPEEFQIDGRHMTALNQITAWKSDYRPSSSPDSNDVVSSPTEIKISAVYNLAEGNLPGRLVIEEPQDKRTDDVGIVPKNPERQGHCQLVKTPAEKLAEESAIKQEEDSQTSLSSKSQKSQMSEYSQTNSFLWQQELDSVHLSCSDESLDFGSPTDHSTQVDITRKPVTRAHRSMRDLRKVAANDFESIKYLGIISQPIKSPSNSSDIVIVEPAHKVETIDPINVTSSVFSEQQSEGRVVNRDDTETPKGNEKSVLDYSGEHDKTGTRGISLDSSDNSETRYLGLVTQALKSKENIIEQVKRENDKTGEVSNALNGSSEELTHDCEIKIESDISSPSLLQHNYKESLVQRQLDKTDIVIDIEENEVERERSKIPISLSSTSKKSSSKFSDSAHQISLKKQSELSLNLSSDKSVISPSPEADVSYFSPFSLTGNVSRLISTRIRNYESSDVDCQLTKDNIGDKSCLLPIIANQTDPIKTTEQVIDGSVINKMFHVASRRTDSETLPIEKDTGALAQTNIHQDSVAGKTNIQECSAGYPEKYNESDIQKEPVQTVDAEVTLPIVLEESLNMLITCPLQKDQGCGKQESAKAQNNNFGKTESVVKEIRLHRSSKPEFHAIKDCSVRLLRMNISTATKPMAKKRSKIDQASETVKDLIISGCPVKRNRQGRNKRKTNSCIKSNAEASSSVEAMANDPESGFEIRELDSSKDSSVREETINLSPAVGFKSIKLPSSGKIINAKPASKWEENFFEWAKSYDESGCNISQCMDCEPETQSIKINDSNIVNDKFDKLARGNFSSCLVNQTSVPEKELVNGISSVSSGTAEYGSEIVEEGLLNQNYISELEKESKDSSKNSDETSKSEINSSDIDNDMPVISKCMKNKLPKHIMEKREASKTNENMLPSTSNDDQTFRHNCLHKQTSSDEPLSFDTDGSPDSLTGTEPFDTQNLILECPVTLAMTDILSGTQPFVCAVSQTQGFVPDLSRSLRSLCSSDGEVSLLSPVEGDGSNKEVSPDHSSSAVGQQNSSIQSGVCRLSNKNQADELQTEEARLKQLCKTSFMSASDQPESGENPEMKCKNSNSTVKYRIFREKARQKSSDELQSRDEIQSICKTAKGEVLNCSRLDRISYNNMKEDDKVVLLSDSSEETVPECDSQIGMNNCINQSVNISTKLIAEIQQNAYKSNANMVTRYSCVSNINTHSLVNSKQKPILKKMSAELKQLNLSNLSIWPVKSTDYAKYSNNILKVKPINKNSVPYISLCNNSSETSSCTEETTTENTTESEFNFEIKKKENIKSYEPQKIVIDGYEMGNKNLWMNLIKSPYQSRETKNVNTKRSQEREMNDNAKRKKVLVRKLIDGVYHFVREPILTNSSSTKGNEFDNGDDSTLTLGSQTIDIDGSPVLVESNSCKEKSVPYKNISGTSNLEYYENAIGTSLKEEEMNDSAYGEKDNLGKDVQRSSDGNTSKAGMTKTKLDKSIRADSYDSKYNNKEIAESASKKSSKRKRKDETKSNSSEIVKTSLPAKRVQTEQICQSLTDVPKRQTTVDKYFKASKKQERKKKHLEELDLRVSFTQEWVEKQTFELHDSPEDSQKSDSSCKDGQESSGADGSIPAPAEAQIGGVNLLGTRQGEEVWSSVSAEPPSEIGQKLLSLKLLKDLKEQAVKLLKE